MPRAAGCGRVWRARLLGALIAGIAAGATHAGSGWIEVRDAGIRADLQFLADEGVIAIPLNTWPMPAAVVRDALDAASVRSASGNDADVTDAASRVRRWLEADSVDGLRFGSYAAASDTPRLRELAAPWREGAEFGANAESVGERVSGRLEVSGTRARGGEESLRVDGSHLSSEIAGWVVSANLLDRHWGPSFESSLILSDNARPMPALMLDRASAKPFETKWLSWIGPWRATLLAARMESERADVDHPLFLGARLEIQPKPWLNVGFSRTAQACGRGRPCNLSTLKDLLLGNDNVGIDATSATEPGNQMAGFDVRIRSPWAGLPVAVYSQMIGEDESGYLPVKFLGQFGVETWRVLPGGGQLRAFLEYADTTCSFNRPAPRFNCAYVQGVFNREGYRYRGRSIGHTADGDAELWSAGLRWQTARSDEWNAHLRTGTLNRDGGVDARNTVSAVAADYSSASIGWRGARGWSDLQIQLGVERYEPPGGGGATGGFGSVRLEKSWR